MKLSQLTEYHIISCTSPLSSHLQNPLHRSRIFAVDEEKIHRSPIQLMFNETAKSC